MKKRIFALVMVIVLLFAFQMPVFAASVQPRSEFYLVMTIISYRGSDIESDESADVWAWLRKYFNLDGHACLYFYNDGDEAVRIGHWTLNPGCDMTIGTFGNRDIHHGIWYNIEAAAASCFSSVNLATLTHMVTADQLSTLNNAINRNDQYDRETDNCVDFATEVWNSVASDSLQLRLPNKETLIKTASTPKILMETIQEKSGHGNTFSMTQKSSQVIAYHTTTGYTYCPSGFYADEQS